MVIFVHIFLMFFVCLPEGKPYRYMSMICLFVFPHVAAKKNKFDDFLPIRHLPNLAQNSRLAAQVAEMSIIRPEVLRVTPAYKALQKCGQAFRLDRNLYHESHPVLDVFFGFLFCFISSLFSDYGQNDSRIKIDHKKIGDVQVSRAKRSAAFGPTLGMAIRGRRCSPSWCCTMVCPRFSAAHALPSFRWSCFPSVCCQALFVWQESRSFSQRGAW